MVQIINRLLAFGEFEIVTFGDDCILNKPIEEWAECDCLLAWHSDGCVTWVVEGLVFQGKTGIWGWIVADCWPGIQMGACLGLGA